MIPTRLMPLGRGGKRLPYDAEVEFVESTGTQRIDTGVILDNTSSWSARAKFASPGTDSFVMGQTANNVANRSAWGLYKSGVWYCGLGNKNWTGGTGDTSWHTFAVDASADTFSVDSTSYSVGHTSFASVANPDGHATLFARRNLSNGVLDTFCKMRLASLAIYQSGVLVRDFISVRVGSGSSAVGYLYDRVSGQLFGNQGTGAFVVGPDK